MSTMLINATRPEELRVAIVKDQILQDLDFERTTHIEKRANIYKARVTSIEPSLDAAFVDFGSEKSGFLPFKEISPEYTQGVTTKGHAKPKIKDVLKINQEMIVQVEKDERGNKGAALTTFISLAGSYLVLMPNNPRAGGISRRVEGGERDDLRQQLSSLNLPEDMGVIVRTAGVGKSQTQLQWDLDVLLTHWQSIQTAAESAKAPFLIHQESDIVLRAIRDYLREDITDIIIDEVSAFERGKEYIEKARPKFSDRIQHYDKPTPLFSHYQIERQIESAHQRVVTLPSGGSIVVDPTEALVSIDINSARSTKGGNIEETAFHTNLEAANEIAKQLRLRDMGGLIVIDFIDMASNQHQREVEQQLRTALKFDRARVQIGRISRFGLLEMSRQRLHTSLGETNKVACPRCMGGGSIRTVESLTLSMLRIIEEVAMRPDVSCVQGQFPVDMTTYLLNEKRQELTDIENRHQVSIIVIANQHMQTPDYQIRHLRGSVYKNLENKPASYKLVRTPTTQATAKTKQFIQPQVAPEKPAVSVAQTRQALPRPKEGFFKRLLSKLFGPSKATTPAKTTQQPPHHRPKSQEKNYRKAPPRRPSQTNKSAGQRQGQGQRQSQGQRQGQGQRQQSTDTRRADRQSSQQQRSQRQGEHKRKAPSLAVKPETEKKPTQREEKSTTTPKEQAPKEAHNTQSKSRSYGSKQPSSRGGRMTPDTKSSDTVSNTDETEN